MKVPWLLCEGLICHSVDQPTRHNKKGIFLSIERRREKDERGRMREIISRAYGRPKNEGVMGTLFHFSLSNPIINSAVLDHLLQRNVCSFSLTDYLIGNSLRISEDLERQNTKFEMEVNIFH